VAAYALAVFGLGGRDAMRGADPSYGIVPTFRHRREGYPRGKLVRLVLTGRERRQPTSFSYAPPSAAARGRSGSGTPQDSRNPAGNESAVLLVAGPEALAKLGLLDVANRCMGSDADSKRVEQDAEARA
jgi:hypothetical protein